MTAPVPSPTPSARALRWLLGGVTPDAFPTLDAAQKTLRARARVALALGDQCAAGELPGAAGLDEDAPAQAVSLYREAVRWALAASSGETAAADLGAGLDAQAASLRRVVGEEGYVAARRALVERAPDETVSLPLEAQRDDAAHAGAVARALVEALHVREIALRGAATRGGGVFAAALALVVVVPAVRAALREDLAARAVWRASSAAEGLPPTGRGAQPTGGAAMFFHTALERGPWVQLDFGARVVLHRIDVENRADCCGERAAPLVMELSPDGAAWTEVARRAEPFGTWTVDLPAPSSRFLRLRALRETSLHLHAVHVH
ncbi:MAG: discoidin domain-containing protein [Polyangiales bacterium]